MAEAVDFSTLTRAGSGDGGEGLPLVTDLIRRWPALTVSHLLLSPLLVSIGSGCW
jgi:hypothetical protein